MDVAVGIGRYGSVTAEGVRARRERRGISTGSSGRARTSPAHAWRAGSSGGWAAGRSRMLQETFEDIDRRVERSAGRAVLLLAVPPAIGHLLAEQPLDDAPHVNAEVRADRYHATVDARLDLPGEHRCAVPWTL